MPSTPLTPPINDITDLSFKKLPAGRRRFRCASINENITFTVSQLAQGRLMRMPEATGLTAMRGLIIATRPFQQRFNKRFAAMLRLTPAMFHQRGAPLV